ncbi:MAG: TIGR02391 family protein [Candidatus Electrothrix sp.]
MNIHFVGNDGLTESCINAVLRYLQFGDQISKALVLTCEQYHALILYIEDDEVVAVRTGFSSGYPGEGPRGLAFVLSLLEKLEITIEEYDVKRNILEKINSGHLSNSELKNIEKAKPVIPPRLRKYIYDHDKNLLNEEAVLERFPLVIPFSIIDPRLFDLALSFWDAPGDKIFTGYKRLEDAIREHCHLDEYGNNLFKKAFLGENSILHWPDLTPGEAVGRANLFIAMYGGFRNRRAHKEVIEDPKSELEEFLTLNLLFRLESRSEKRNKEDE